MLKNIINYQKFDAKLVRLERELAQDESKKVVSAMVASVKDSQSKLMTLEKDAETQVKELSSLKQEYDNTLNDLNSLIKTDVSSMEESKIKETADKINQMSSKLTVIERKLSTYNDKANNILKNFESTKKSIIMSKQKHKEAKDKYDEKVAKLTPQINEIKAELSSLEKTLDKELFAKYKVRRADNIFPVFVPLTNNSCGGCMMGVSQANVQQIKNKGYMECEQCHRIIYIEE